MLRGAVIPARVPVIVGREVALASRHLEASRAPARATGEEPVLEASIDRGPAVLAALSPESLGCVFSATVVGRLAAACARAGRDLGADEWRCCLGDRPYRRTCFVE